MSATRIHTGVASALCSGDRYNIIDYGFGVEILDAHEHRTVWMGQSRDEAIGQLKALSRSLAQGEAK